MSGPLDGVRVLDLSRILAGPTCTQLLADLGADVIKVENPKTGGDDTRSWGPPYVSERGDDEDLSAYFICANRNKRSLAVDLATAAGQEASRARGFHPHALPEPYMNLSAHTAPSIQPFA